MAASHHLEVEDKYDVDDDAELPAFGDWPGVTSVESERFELEATYFDTVDYRAARARITVRRRTGGEDAGWHVKLPADDHGGEDGGRHEIRLPLGRAVHTVPKVLRDLLRATLRDEAMTPVAVLRTDRTVHRLRGEGGVVLAEVADDRVSAGDSRHGTLSTWREWEVELVAGDRSLLRTARKRLGKAGAVPSASGSKLARTLGAAVPAPVRLPAPRKKGPAGDVVRSRLAEQHAALLRLDPAVRRDERDAVHQMRVAVRRLRSALATYRPFLDRSVSEPVRDELRWLGGVLGDARDAQVQRRYLARRLDELTDELPGHAEAWSVVGERTDEWWARARQGVMTELASDRYLALLEMLAALVEDTPLTGRAERAVRSAMTGRVRHEWSRAVKRLRQVDEVDDADRDEALHEARKALKRVRYAVEPLRGVYGKDAKRLVKRLKRVQTVLGDHQDAVTAQEWLVTAADGRSAAGFTLGVVHERLEEVKRDQEDRFEGVWHRASRPAARAWLG